MGREGYAVKPSFEEIFEGKEADESIYEAFTRNESIKHNFYFFSLTSHCDPHCAAIYAKITNKRQEETLREWKPLQPYPRFEKARGGGEILAFCNG